MAPKETKDASSVDATKADHFCVLVHGLWGNPSHLQQVATKLKERHGADKLHVLVANRNANSYTYDGIVVGGERLAQEVEDELKALEERGNHITKISVVGYSLGGLVARYAIGLLYSRGWFEKLQPVNFTAFASPFLGVKAPNRSFFTKTWNYIGGQLLSQSGKELFLLDQYRDSGKCLLEVLVDPNSIFIEGLKQFQRRTLYANAVNDRSAPWFTTGISRSDPFISLDDVKLNYLDKTKGVLLDPDNPVQLKTKPVLDFQTRMVKNASSLIHNFPTYALMTVLLPIGLTAFVSSAVVQTIRSNQRIQLHNTGKAGSFDVYRIPYLMDSAIESINANEAADYLTDESTSSTGSMENKRSEMARPNTLKRMRSRPDFPTLALDPRQFEMINVLNDVGFRKYPVHITKVRHSHAAIIVRRNWESMNEGYVVINHWLDNEFQI